MSTTHTAPSGPGSGHHRATPPILRSKKIKGSFFCPLGFKAVAITIQHDTLH
jgi:hypothetical protein